MSASAETSELQLTSASELPLKPYYTPEDREGTSYEQIGDPGAYPYTRGFHATAYNKTPWMMQQVLGAGLAEHTRAIMDRLVAEGMEGYFGFPVFNVVFDNPTKGGIDPDRPEAKGHVGVGGMNLSHIDDLRRLVKGLPLDKINLSMITGDTCLIALAMYLVAAEEYGYGPEQLKGNSMNWLLKSFCVDNPDFPPRNALKLSVQLIKYCTEHMPYWNTTNFSGYLIREAGCSGVQELAFTMAWGIATIEECVKEGLDVDDFAQRLGFQIAFHNDFFEEIAKLRALRRMWAKVLSERFGASNPKALRARVHIHTAGDTLLAQQPHNNIVRVALQTLGSVLAGVQSIHSCAYTETLQIPNEEQGRLALRTQQVVLHETSAGKVADPLGGSWYLEDLTDRVEAAAWDILDQIDGMGGFIPAIESGWVKGQIVDELFKTHEKIDSGDLVRVGLNKHVVDAPETRPDVFRIDPAIEQEAVDRITAWKANRDQQEVQERLDAVRRAAEADGQLMPAVMEAVKAKATQGEVMDVLKDVYGWGFVTN
jgi:methylmalonyl-CoA mutase N-terminal domain/subunit